MNDQRQAGAAIEGVIRHEELDITQLAVDTHGHTDFAMALAKLLGFDLCPRSKALEDRHLFLPRGRAILASVQEICRASVDLERIRLHWEQIVHLVASVHSGHTSAVRVTARFGSAARGDPLYEAIVHLGRLLRTVFLCDYFLNYVFRRGFGTCSTAVRPSMPCSARSTHAPPTRTEGINLRGIFRFPVERDVDKILPSVAAEKRTVTKRSRDFALQRSSARFAKSDTCTQESRDTREIYPPATVCYCTKNEGTPASAS